MINIILDDFRDEMMCYNTTKNPMYIDLKWDIIRNYKDFVIFIDNFDFKKELLISFDHDLSDFHKGEEFTGKTAIDYLINYCLDNNKKFPNWYVHTDNTSGRVNIIGAALNYLKAIEGFDTSDFRYYHKGIINGLIV